MQYVSPTFWDLNGTLLMLNIYHTLLDQCPILSKLTKINAIHMKTCTQIFKTHLQIIGIQVQNNNKQHLFFLCDLEFQNMKDETLK
jgi:hypothetical protein